MCQSFVVANAYVAVVGAVVDADSDDSHLVLLPVYATNFHVPRHGVAYNLIADMSLVTCSTTQYISVVKCRKIFIKTDTNNNVDIYMKREIERGNQIFYYIPSLYKVSKGLVVYWLREYACVRLI